MLYRMSDEKAEKHGSDAGRTLGRLGGAARTAALTPEERSESARRAVRARWKRSTPEATAAQGEALAAGRARMSPEARSRAAKRSWITRRARAAKRDGTAPPQ